MCTAFNTILEGCSGIQTVQVSHLMLYTFACFVIGPLVNTPELW